MEGMTKMGWGVLLILAISFSSGFADGKNKLAKTIGKEVFMGDSKQKMEKNKLEIKRVQEEVRYSTIKQVIIDQKNVADIRGEAIVRFENDTLVKVQKSDNSYDGKRTPENPLEQYVAKASEVMDVLELSLTESGEIAMVKNQDSVVQRWSCCEAFLERYFVSDDPSVKKKLDYLAETFKNSVKDEVLFLSIVKGDLFYATFFHGFYRDYGEEGCFSRKNVKTMGGSNITSMDEKWTLLRDGGQSRVRVEGSGISEDSGSDVYLTYKSEATFDEDGVAMEINTTQKTVKQSGAVHETRVVIKREK